MNSQSAQKAQLHKCQNRGCTNKTKDKALKCSYNWLKLRKIPETSSFFQHFLFSFSEFSDQEVPLFLLLSEPFQQFPFPETKEKSPQTNKLINGIQI